MTSLLPLVIQQEVDGWLQQRGWLPSEWSVHRISGSGLSDAGVWHLARRDLTSTVAPFRPYQDHGGLGYAIRSWGRSHRDRSSMDRILFFQQTCHLSLKRIPSIFVDSSTDMTARSIVPNLLAWTKDCLCLERTASLWTIETWQPGKSIEAGRIVSDWLIHQALEVLESLHATGRKLGIQRMIAPGMIERISGLRRWKNLADDAAWKQKAESIGDRLPWLAENMPWRTIVGKSLDHLRRHELSLRNRLQPWLCSPVECHWIVRDLWRENILLEGDEVTGIVDFGAARIDWPGFDNVRWFGSWLAADDPRICNLMTNADAGAEDTFRFLDHLATLLSLFQWLDWLVRDEISWQGRESIVLARICELDRRLSKFDD